MIKYLVTRFPNFFKNRWFAISKNLNDDLELITDEEYKYFRWDWDGLCLNPNLTEKLITMFLTKLGRNNYDLIVQNHYSLTESYQGPFEYNDKHKKNINDRVNYFKEELMAKTWNPQRIEAWCLDIETLRELNLT